MSKFIKKQQYNSIDENIYDEFVDIDSITIEEIDKDCLLYTSRCV